MAVTTTDDTAKPVATISIPAARHRLPATTTRFSP